MLGELLLSVVSGGMTGILGGGLQLLFAWLNTRAEIEKARVENQLKIDLVNAKATAAERVAIAEAEAKAAEFEGKALEASQESFNRSYLTGIQPPRNAFLRGIIYFLLGLMETLRAVIRPGLTIYLVWLCDRLYNDVQRLLVQVDFAFKPDQIAALYDQIVLTFLYLLVTCVSWWFVTRNKSKPPELSLRR